MPFSDTRSHDKSPCQRRPDKLQRRKTALVIRTEEEELKDIRTVKRAIKKDDEADETEEAMETEENVKEIDEYDETKETEETYLQQYFYYDEEVDNQTEPEDPTLDVTEDVEVPINIKSGIPKYDCKRSSWFKSNSSIRLFRVSCL